MCYIRQARLMLINVQTVKMGSDGSQPEVMKVDLYQRTQQHFFHVDAVDA